MRHAKPVLSSTEAAVPAKHVRAKHVRAKQRLRQKRASWQRRLRYLHHRFVRLRGHPEAIARGIAVGVFAGWFPWFGLQIIIAVALAALFRGNKVTAAAATWVSNPFTYVPIFAFNFQAGQRLLGFSHKPFGFAALESWQDVMNLGTDFLFTLLVGCLVVGLLCAIASYGLSLWLIRQVRQRRFQQRHHRQSRSSQ
jgi:uncharacterized protein (DUF2062 family)